jgi:hypothetical protein
LPDFCSRPSREQAVHRTARERVPLDAVGLLLERRGARFEEAVVAVAHRGELGGGGLAEPRTLLLLVKQHVEHALAERVREHAGQAQPARHAPVVGRAHVEHALAPVDLADLPRAPGEPKAQRALRVVVHRDEERLDVADVLLAVLHAHDGRRGEDRVELEEVLLAVELLSARAERQQSIGLVQDLALEHRVDQLGYALGPHRRERIRRLDPRHQRVPRDAALLKDERHHLVREHVHRVRGGRDVLDPARLRETQERHRLEQRLGAEAEERAVGARVRPPARASEALEERGHRPRARRPG